MDLLIKIWRSTNKVAYFLQNFNGLKILLLIDHNVCSISDLFCAKAIK